MSRKRSRDQKSLAIRFLLGETTEEERIDVEARCLANEDFFSVVLDAERSLLDDYAAGALKSELRERFERNYLASPRHAAGVRLEQALRHRSRPAAPADEARSPEVAAWSFRLGRRLPFQWPVLRLAMAAVILIAVAAAAVLAIWNQQLQDRLSQNGVELAGAQLKIRDLEHRASAQAAITAAVPSTMSGPAAISGGVVEMALEPGLLRGDDRPSRVTLKPESRLLWLRLLVGADSYQSYRVIVSTPEGQQLARFDSVKAQKTDSATGVDVTLPSSLFPRATTCMVRLSGFRPGRAAEDLGVYVVEITR